MRFLRLLIDIMKSSHPNQKTRQLLHKAVADEIKNINKNGWTIYTQRKTDLGISKLITKYKSNGHRNVE